LTGREIGVQFSAGARMDSSQLQGGPWALSAEQLLFPRTSPHGLAMN